jgi:transcriptional regulator with XRE-family HTH domain
MSASPLTEENGLIAWVMGTFSERLREFMAATKWTVGEVALAAGVSSSAVSQWRGDKVAVTKDVSWRAAVNIQNKTGFSALWLFRGEGPKMAAGIRPELALSDALVMLAGTMAAQPKIKRDGVKAYLAHLVDGCEDEAAVSEAVTMIAETVKTKQPRVA